MLGEHVLYSLAVAIIFGTLYERKYGYALPIWIIVACAWAPDADYIIQHICFTYCYNSRFFIEHGDFHNLFIMLLFAFVAAYLFEKYKNYDFKNTFLCVMVGLTTHMLCDYLVYPSTVYPLSRLFPSIKLTYVNVIPEMGSWHGIGEPRLFVGGFILVLLALIVNFIYSESKWITTRQRINAQDMDAE